jgi:hypothetical protein
MTPLSVHGVEREEIRVAIDKGLDFHLRDFQRSRGE